VRHKESSFQASPPTGVTCFQSPPPPRPQLHTYLHLLLCPTIGQRFKSHDFTRVTSSNPALMKVKQKEVLRVGPLPNEQTGQTVRMHLFGCVRLHASPWDAALKAVRVVTAARPYSAAQRCSWPGAAC